MLLEPLNPRSRLLRWPLKAAFVTTVTLLVCYPNPARLASHLAHWSDPGSLIEPDEPSLAPLAEEVEQYLLRFATPPDAGVVLDAVQHLVTERIQYAWDWDTWGCCDYLPTVAETMQRGREDCDGRAVVAASILRKLGYESRLMTDGSHMWVWTASGETMDPMPTASGRTLLRTTETGTKVDLLAVIGVRALLVDWPKNLAYGAAVFPPARVGLIAAAIVLCWFRSRPGLLNLGGGLGLMVSGLYAWRHLCDDPWNNSLPGAWLGIGLCLLALGVASMSGPGRGDEEPSGTVGETPNL